MQRFEFTKDLKANDRFNFIKEDGESYNKIQADLSWSVELNSELKALDLDACAFLVGEDGIIMDDADFVYYNSIKRWLPSDPRWMDHNLRNEIDVTEGDFQQFDNEKYQNKRVWRKETLPVSNDGALIGSWDDPGDGDNDESGETMHVLLNKIDKSIREIIFCVSIYPNPKNGPLEQQTFDKVKNAKIEISDEETGNILCSFNLKEEFAGRTAVEVGKLAKNQDGDWEFIAFGLGHDGGIQTLADIYA